MRPNQRMAKELSGLAVPLVQAERPLPRRGVGLVAFNRIPRILTSIFILDPSATYILSQCMLHSQGSWSQTGGECWQRRTLRRIRMEIAKQDTKKEARGAGRFRSLY